MGNKGLNYAFIDCQNLHKAILHQGWYLSYKRFRKYLADKYGIEKAFMFVGYLPGNEWLYSLIRNTGYIVVFKPTLRLADGTVKGNVDAELVLHTMIEYPNFEKALIVTGDGDFYCLVEHLIKNGKLLKVMVPDSCAYSCFFRRFGLHLVYMNTLRSKLEHKKERH